MPGPTKPSWGTLTGGGRNALPVSLQRKNKLWDSAGSLINEVCGQRLLVLL